MFFSFNSYQSLEYVYILGGTLYFPGTVIVKAELLEWTWPGIVYVTGEHNSVTEETHNLEL